MSSNTTTDFALLKQSVDDFFIMSNGIFISMMQAGFACLEVGAVRTKNATNIIMKNMLDMVICCFAYYMVGFAFAYGDGNAFIGYRYFAGVGLERDALVNWFFQFIFAATTATIVSGAVAERCNFVAYLVYSAVISGFVYPVVTHWAWSPRGWLHNLGFHDLSGCGVVHALAGTIAFGAAAFLGPRKGRFDGKGNPQPISGHSTPISGIGALLLLTGFLAFNGGAIFHVTEKGDSGLVAKSMINTVIAGTGGSFLTLTLCRLRLVQNQAPWPFSLILNGTLAGMASSCAAPHQYEAWAMFVIGAISALVYIFLHKFVLFLKVDDPLDATALHFAGGTWGMAAEGIFNPDGLIYQWSTPSLLRIAYNLTGLAAIVVWGALWATIIFGGLKFVGLLRVSEKEETEGLDVPEHGEAAYPKSAWTEEDMLWKPFGPSIISEPVIFEKLYPPNNSNIVYPIKQLEDPPPFEIALPNNIWNTGITTNETSSNLHTPRTPTVSTFPQRTIKGV